MIKLATIPSGYKTSKLYSVVPNDGLGDFTFVRTTEATRINEDGLIEALDANIPRLDYSKSGCPELLMERASTNLITYSEDASQGILSNCTVQSGFVSPNGFLSAYKLIEDSANSIKLFRAINSTATTPNNSYASSIFVKKGERTKVRVYAYHLTNQYFYVEYDLTDNSYLGSFGQNSQVDGYAIEDIGDNGWKRITIIGQKNASYSWDVGVSPLNDNGDLTYLGDGTSGLYIWGAQLEQSTKATSYIPSLLGTATTRAIDRITDLTTIDVTSDDWTLFINADYTDLNFSFGCISINDGDDDNNLRIMNIESSEEVRVTNRVGGTGVNNYNIFYGTWGYKLKIGIVSTSNGIDIYVNGQLASSQTAGRIDMSGMTNIGLTDGSGDNFLGRLKDFRYYDTNLSSSELIKLTK